MKLSVRLACIIHSMQGAKNFDILCCGRGKSHIDARTGVKAQIPIRERGSGGDRNSLGVEANGQGSSNR